MSVSRFLNRWLNRLYKTLAILLVLIAVSISAIRLFLPYAHNYKAAFENYINETYNSHITVESITMGWQKFGPTLVARNVSLLQTEMASIGIKNIDIRVNFWESLSNRQLVAHHLTLDGVDVFYDQTQTISTKKQKNEQQLLDNITDLFLTQLERFSLKNSEVFIKTAWSERKFLINHLNWLNKGTRHQANGDVRIDGVSSNHLKILLDLKGEGKNKLAGQVYLQANQLNITPWLDRVFAIENEKTDSNINFDAWLSIDKGQPKNLLVSLRDNNVSWKNQGINNEIALNNGQLFFQKNVDGFTLNSTPLELIQNGSKWQPINLALHRDNQLISGYISSLDITGLAQVYPLISGDEASKKMLDELAPIGKLSDIYFEKSQDNLNLAADFSLHKINFSGGIPGVNNLIGKLVLSEESLNVNLVAKNGVLDFDKHFLAPIPYNMIAAQLDVDFSQQDLAFYVSNVGITSDELSLQADVRVDIPQDGEAAMALLVAAKNIDAKNASHYYPHLLMGQNLVDYLNGSIVDGEISQANVLFNGPFSKFPFNAHEGIFVVDAELNNSLFRFDEKWPAINAFDANLNFTNNSMLITAREGTLSGLDVEGVEAGITELTGTQILTVDVNITDGSPRDVTQLMLASPLANSVGTTLEQIYISQPLTVDFHLDLPLKDTDAVVAAGLVNFDQNEISLKTPEMEFAKVTGQLSFKNEEIKAQGLALEWRGMPLLLDVNANEQAEFYQTNISIDANWQQAQWQAQIPELLQKYSEGQLQWQGELALYQHKSGGFSYDLAIDSDLNKTALKIPKPYQISLDESVPFNAQIDGHGAQSTITVNLGEQLSFYGVLNHKDVQFSRSHLVLGDEKMLLPMDGFHITTNLEYAELTQWQPFISDILNSIESKGHQSGQSINPNSQLFPIPERIRGTIAQFDILGQPLTDVSFNLLDKTTWWLLQLNAKEARAQLKFYPNWLEQGVDVNADFLHFPEREEETIAEVAQDSLQEKASAALITDLDQNAAVPYDNDNIFRHVPPIKFHCDSCKLGVLDFGAVDFSIERGKNNTISMKQFRAQRDKSELTFDMMWRHDGKISKTDLSGNLRINDLAREVEKLDYASIIKESGVKATFEGSWRGGPQNFDIEDASGALSVKIDDGYLADVGDKAKIFSVLSLQSLLRKLTLDFRDIFSDGMFYSSISGDFELKDGILYTDNTKMIGAAGNMHMQGNTELTQGMLDYKLSYKPNLTSSLPVLAWIATLQPTIFLAGIAIDQVITSQVVSEFNFELTGSLDEPDMKEVDRITKDISVGRSAPPQIVEQKDAEKLPSDKKNQEPEKPLKPSTSIPSNKEDIHGET